MTTTPERMGEIRIWEMFATLVDLTGCRHLNGADDDDPCMVCDLAEVIAKYDPDQEPA